MIIYDWSKIHKFFVLLSFVDSREIENKKKTFCWLVILKGNWDEDEPLQNYCRHNYSLFIPLDCKKAV